MYALGSQHIASPGHHPTTPQDFDDAEHADLHTDLAAVSAGFLTAVTATTTEDVLSNITTQIKDLAERMHRLELSRAGQTHLVNTQRQLEKREYCDRGVQTGTNDVLGIVSVRYHTDPSTTSSEAMKL